MASKHSRTSKHKKKLADRRKYGHQPWIMPTPEPQVSDEPEEVADDESR